MASFDRIKVGDVLYDCHRQRMGNTTMTRMACFTVKVLEIDAENRRATVSWNDNRPVVYHEHRIKRLRRTPARSR